MANETRPESDYGRSLERHTGSDALIKFRINDPALESEDEWYEIPVTNVDWSADYDMNEIQHNGSLEATLTPTGIRYSGSFEWSGQNPQAMHLLVRGDPDFSGTDLPEYIDTTRPTRFNMTVKEYNHEDNAGDNSGTSDGKVIESTYKFKRCMIESVNRDLSSGDSSNASYDFSAETMKPIRGVQTSTGNGG